MKVTFIVLGLAIIGASVALDGSIILESYNRNKAILEDEFEERRLRVRNKTMPFSKTTPAALRIGLEGQLINRVANELGISNVDVQDEADDLGLICPSTQNSRLPVGVLNSDGLDFGYNCNSLSQENFRRVDGSCNNLEFPHWGSRFQIFRRLFDNTYADGVDELTPNLPNPRLISTTIHPDAVELDLRITNMVMQIGQFLDHDTTLAPEFELECCEHDMNSGECVNVEVPQNDPFFRSVSSPPDCLPLARSIPTCANTQNREHFNIITAFLDLSNIYGSDEELHEHLLDPSDRSLLLEGESFPGALPTQFEATGEDEFESNRGLFISGDIRTNENPGLASMHTLFLREHNRIARELRGNNRFLDDDAIFNLARRINAAQWQHVVYAEWLPVLVGPELAESFFLDTSERDSFYLPKFNPSILHSFGTAAFRFGHTLVPGAFEKYTNGESSSSFLLRENFGNPDEILMNNGDGFDRIMEGLINQPGQNFDEVITEELTNHLFQEPGHDFGQDLVMRNLQRGREHGIASYSEFRNFCGLGREFTSEWAWSQPDEISDELWAQLQEVYNSPLDIELFTGGLVETPNSRAVVGPTFGCLISYQFFLLKYGDRFFYTHRCFSNYEADVTLDSTLFDFQQRGVLERFIDTVLNRGENSNCGIQRFTPQERQEIEQRSLGDIICDNVDSIDSTTELVTLVGNIANRETSCGGRRPLNVNVFQNRI